MTSPASHQPPLSGNDHYWMSQALQQAKLAWQQGEVPVGAVLVKDEQLIAKAYNQPISHCDPSAHAEINVLRKGAKKLENYRLIGTTLYVTLEPCIMCLGAMLHARISRLVYGAADPKVGAVKNLSSIVNVNHRMKIESGICNAEASQLLRDFFRTRR